MATPPPNNRFLGHSSVASPKARDETQVAVNVAGIAENWERRRAPSSPVRQSAGGATAPTTVSVSTPPARRQRLHAFDVSGNDVDSKLENLRQQLVAEFGRVHQDIAALNTWNQNSTADFVTTENFDKFLYEVDKKTAGMDGLIRNLGAQTMAVADQLTALELQNANMSHLIAAAAERETELVEKLKVLADELQRWTTASAEQASLLASMQEQADSAFARSMAQISDGDEAMKGAIELQVNILKSEVATLKMAATQASIIHGASRANEAAAASGMPRAHGPFGAGNGVDESHTATAPVRMPPGMAGKSPCHCRHVDELKDRLEAAEARLAEADKFCELLKTRVDVIHESREKFMKDCVFNPPAGRDHDGGGGGDQGPGGGNGGSGGGAPSFGGGGNFDRPSADAVKWSSKIFDDRVAQSAPFQYEEAKSDAWRIRVRGYLIGACPEIAPVLNWAEQRGGAEIDQGDAEFTTTRSLNHSIMGEADKVVLSGLVWKFLQLCCINSSHASTTFQAAQPELNGLEVWRLLIW